MKISTNINILLTIISISIISHYVHTLSLHDRKSSDKIGMESYMFDDASSSIDEQESIENKHPTENYPIRNPRRLDSAEKYFDWASKTNRPMEYLRGKRFWLFTKKDEHAHNHETNPNTGTSPGSFGQGIWRSGIVGRRRRR